jgi:putative FmdB family regulatory protein
MPIYEYSCGACGADFEVMQKLSDRPIRKCEKCGKLKAKRHISQTTFLLKGTGWYTTDYAGRKAHGGADGDSTSAAAASAAEVKSEPAKPAASEPAAPKPSEGKPKPKSKKAAGA